MRTYLSRCDAVRCSLITRIHFKFNRQSTSTTCIRSISQEKLRVCQQSIFEHSSSERMFCVLERMLFVKNGKPSYLKKLELNPTNGTKVHSRVEVEVTETKSKLIFLVSSININYLFTCDAYQHEETAQLIAYKLFLLKHLAMRCDFNVVFSWHRNCYN